MTLQQKRNIDLIGPLVLAGLAGMVYFSKARNKNWQVLLAIMVLTFGILYIISTKITKSIMLTAPVTQLPNDVGLTQCSAFDPTRLTDDLKNDLYVPIFSIGSRDVSLYTKLNALSNCELVKVYNDWNQRYYSLHSESLPIAIDAEIAWPGTGFASAKSTILRRFDSLNLS